LDTIWLHDSSKKNAEFKVLGLKVLKKKTFDLKKIFLAHKEAILLPRQNKIQRIHPEPEGAKDRDRPRDTTDRTS
jgi:hypothetical protein